MTRYKFTTLLFLFVPILVLADAAPEWGFYGLKKPVTKADSILKESKKSYPASNAVDNNVTTAWCEGAKGSGIGESIEVQFSPTPGIGLSVFPGFGGNKRLYYSNNRIKDYELVVTFQNGRSQKIKGRFEDNLCGHPDHRECNQYDNDIQKYEACEKRMQSLCYFNENNQGGQILFDKPKCVTKVKLKILSVYKGKKHDDTCIAEMSLFRPIDRPREEVTAFDQLLNSCK